MSRVIFLSKYLLTHKCQYSNITVKIGNVSMKINEAVNKELVPINYLKYNDDDKILQRHCMSNIIGRKSIINNKFS